MYLLTKRATPEHLSFVLDTVAQDYPCGSLCPHSVGKRNASGIQMMARSSTRSWGLVVDSGTKPSSCVPLRQTQKSIVGNCGSLQRQLQLSMWLLIWSIFYFWHLPSKGFTKKGKIYLPCESGRLDTWIPTCSSLDDKTAQSVLSLAIYLQPLLWRTWVTMCVQICIWVRCVKEPLSSFTSILCVCPIYIAVLT